MSFIFKYRKCAEALYYALIEDAFYITMEKSVEHENSSREAMFRYMEYSMIEAQASGELFIPDGHNHGASIWSKPICHDQELAKEQEKENFISNEMGERSLETYKAIVDFMSAQSAPIVKTTSWYLSIVGLLPEFQGQGRGSGLIEDVLKKTDDLGVETYLETFTPRNMTFYQRFGYKTVSSFDEPTTEARYWLMIRQPQINKTED